MKGKVLVLSLVIAALSITCSTSSLAYLMDVDSSVTTFTTGQIEIRTLTASIGRGSTVSDADIIDSANNYSTYLNNNCTNMLGGSTCDKHVFIQNTGSTSAYVRVRVLIPERLISGESPLFTFNRSSSEFTETARTGIYCEGTSGELCTEYTFTRAAALPANTMTSQSAIDSFVYNVVATTSSTNENTTTASEPIDLTDAGIRIYTEAIQAQGFASVTDAFNNF